MAQSNATLIQESLSFREVRCGEINFVRTRKKPAETGPLTKSVAPPGKLIRRVPDTLKKFRTLPHVAGDGSL